MQGIEQLTPAMRSELYVLS